ncbi:DNA-directed RNA polymerase III subunit RPC7 [Aphidius gifuensis]|uniref:DNA-directed RNA polymerase III subunit RPC7 n=1 Tax=Aphidius gifuensis TaxID=684658 RepID=UPI001CDD1AD1|nr:DNA-directed RNA polymerase III subunit RPC7 [Aphidius gifuensis]
MAGRGGRGKPAMSFSAEQVGLNRNEGIPSVLQPLPDYPTPEFKAPQLQFTTELGYWIQLKADYAEYIKDSSNNVPEATKKKDIERYSDHFNALINTKISYEKLYDWTKLPSELKPGYKRKRTTNDIAKKIDNVDKKLDEYEKKDTYHSDDDDDDEEGKAKKTKGDDDDDDKDPNDQLEDEEDEDDEMDDGTDYVNNYFDNGEAYEEEDDNLDDGPVY